MSAENTVDAPGAFPTTPVAEEPLRQQTTHNKLHKREDPRTTGGMDESLESSRGHYHTGAGGAVGNAPTQPQDSQSSNYIYNNEGPTATDGTNTRSNPSEATSNDFNTTSSSTEDEPAHGIVRNGLKEKSTVGSENPPYWGNIPSGGTHNSVIGHGSNEDEGHMHERTTAHENFGRAVPSHHRQFPLVDHSQDNVPSGGVYNTVTGHGSAEDSQGPTTRDLPDRSRNTSTLDDRSKYSEVPNQPLQRDENTTDSHHGRDAGMALAGATTAYAAHERSNKHEEHAAEHEQPVEKKESKIAGLFHRDHEDKQSKPKKVEDEQPKEKKESKIAALFHHSSSGKEEPEAKKAEEKKFEPTATHVDDQKHRHQREALAAAPATRHYTQEPGKVQDTGDKPNDHHYGAAAAATGAGLGAGYGAHRYANRDEQAAAPVTHYSTQEPGKVQESEYKPHDNHNGAAAAATGAGLGAAYGAHRYADRDVHENENAAATEEPTSSFVPTSSVSASSLGHNHAPVGSQYDTLRDGVPSGVSSEDNYNRNDRQHGAAAVPGLGQSQKHTPAESQYDTLKDGTPSGVASEDTPNDRHYGTAAAATGAGLGAAYGAHRYANREPETDKAAPTFSTQRETVSQVAPTPAAGTRLDPSQTQTPRESKYDTLNDGVPSGINTGQSSSQYETPRGGSKHDNLKGGVSSGVPTAHANVGRGSSDSSHGGQYNVLSSGTPSGINLENQDHTY
ncbi:hypothetical protein GGR57DRAFT_472709 [Xylariaceae sp. FL1272]|nr:hypothetical protein GGR57DRAFT_472709 [Xylariaceae sp. FL1272]